MSANLGRFLDLADIGREGVLDLLKLALRLESHPEPQALAGKILGLVFLMVVSTVLPAIPTPTAKEVYFGEGKWLPVSRTPATAREIGISPMAANMSTLMTRPRTA